MQTGGVTQSDAAIVFPRESADRDTPDRAASGSAPGSEALSPPDVTYSHHTRMYAVEAFIILLDLDLVVEQIYIDTRQISTQTIYLHKVVHSDKAVQ